MKTAFFALTATAILISCQKKSGVDESQTTAKTDSITAIDVVAPNVPQCYEFVQAKDTISFTFLQDGAAIDGQLRFQNYEKDSSAGKAVGTVSGDTLKLDYTFQAEGTTSVREMRFLKSGKTLVMGTGDMQDQNGKMTFTKPSEVKYEKAIVLVKTDCQ